MDPLTHTLVGASLAATQLGKKTRLAAPALIVGANLPDLDVLSYFRGGDFALGFRRGWTHGLPALVVLPIVLSLLLWLWGRWRGPDDSQSPLDLGWLLGLSFLACLTHPFLDWLNTYGMRWLMPLRDTWFYGDSVFIMDPYLWLILGLGWALGRRPSWTSGSAATLMAGLVIWLVGSRAPAYLPVVGAVFALLLLGFLWRPRKPATVAPRAAILGLVVGALYIGSLIAVHWRTLSAAQVELESRGIVRIEEMLVGPTPANPLAWDVLVSTDGAYQWGRYDWRHRSLGMSKARLPGAREAPIWPEILASGQAQGFLHWVRFPWFQVETTESGRRVYLMDGRYVRARASGFGAAVIELDTD